MSVARACRRFRQKIKHDPRYNRQPRRDAAARARRLAAQVADERRRAMKAGK